MFISVAVSEWIRHFFFEKNNVLLLKYKYIIIMKNIEWKYIGKSKGFKSVQYFISNTGLIKTITKSGKNKIYNGHNRNGYRYCSLGFIHRLVAQAFIPNDGNKPYVDHIDGNRINNNVENLRWCTQKENVNYPIVTKRREKYYERTFGKKRKKIKNVIWWQQIDDNGNVVKEWESLCDAAKELGSTKQKLWNASKSGGKSSGFRWKKILKKTVSLYRAF